MEEKELLNSIPLLNKKVQQMCYSVSDNQIATFSLQNKRKTSTIDEESFDSASENNNNAIKK